MDHLRAGSACYIFRVGYPEFLSSSKLYDARAYYFYPEDFTLISFVRQLHSNDQEN